MSDRAGSHQGPHAAEVEHPHSWWKVMCLTGVDYFSSLGYAPAIAFVAAGVVSPFATLVLVALTLLGALPVYRRVSRESFKGSGSLAMLERLLPWWGGKLFVLVLLGFAATDFIITITLSASDAAAHAAENPYFTSFLHGHNIALTILLVLLLGAVFLKGFKEAIGVAVVLVGVYLALNVVVIGDALWRALTGPGYMAHWTNALTLQHPDPLAIVGVSLIVFPKLALGMSGFETGVAVMPQIQGDPDDDPAYPRGRIRGTGRLLTTAAIIMSALLFTSSIACTLLIPAQDFQSGGPADGRALAYLAHLYLGPVFGTVYDFSTIAILWFAGASAMAGLLNLVPRYLPRYGMAPRWASAVRPLVVVMTLIALGIVLIFKADVNAQGGAYATGVLVLMTSAAIAVTISCHRKNQHVLTWVFGVISAVFVYTTVDNTIERPDGVRIAAFFIVAIMIVSIASRVRRSFEIRASSITFDDKALEFIHSDAQQQHAIRIVAHEPDVDTKKEYREKVRAERRFGHIPGRSRVILLEVWPRDSSDFQEDLEVRGIEKFGYRLLKVHSGTVPNTIASLLMYVRDETGIVPEIYFQWSEMNPVANMGKYLVEGAGEVAAVCHEVLRQAEHDPKRRPSVHVS
ncbi:APC family permease [Tsukamurella soli]